MRLRHNRLTISYGHVLKLNGDLVTLVDVDPTNLEKPWIGRSPRGCFHYEAAGVLKAIKAESFVAGCELNTKPASELEKTRRALFKEHGKR